jgi:DNA-binding transcriptional LysR family regulator
MNWLGKSLPPLASLLPFEAAARHESFTKAAEELHLTQAAVSRQIRALEDDLSMHLFERRNRAVHLTDAGRAFARVVAGGLESIAAQAGHLRGLGQSGEVIFFSQLCEAFYWVMPRLSEFHRRHPDIEVRVAASTKPLAEASGYFDVALQTSNRASGSHPLVFTVPDEVFPICSPAYLAGRKTPLDLVDLSSHHLLHHQAYPQDWIEWDGWLERLGLDLRVGHRGSVYDSYPVMIQAAVEGHGITLGWRSTMDRLLRSGTLVRPFDESVILPGELSVYRRRGARRRPEAEALIAWLKSELSPR